MPTPIACARIKNSSDLGSGMGTSRHSSGRSGVGERDRQHIVVQTFFGSLDPGLEPIALPMLWPNPDQYDPGCLHEQRAQIAIAAPGYLAEDGTVSRRYLLWHQSEPGAEVAAFGECG